MSSKTKQSLDPGIFMGKLAEQAERYHDVFDFLSNVLKKRVSPCHYTADERNMLSVAFKNMISPKRSTWRQIIATKSDTEAVS